MIPRKSFLILIISVIFVFLTGCSKSEEKTAEPPKPEAPVVETKPISNEKVTQICAEYYNAEGEYRYGINLKKTNLFFITIAKNAPIPVKVGDILTFAKSGEASIQEIGRMETPKDSRIFITVDKTLDPWKDGYPNPIQISEAPLSATNYSYKEEYLNGIHLKRKNLFFITIGLQEKSPFVIGDKIKMAKTGEVSVKTVNRTETKDSSRIFVEVDKSLDPRGDGYPNPITLIGK